MEDQDELKHKMANAAQKSKEDADDQFLKKNKLGDGNPNKSPLATNFLRSTGLLDAYEEVVASMISEGWPSETNIFDHAAYLLLKWQSENQDAITIQAATFRRQFLLGGKPVPTASSDFEHIGGQDPKKPKNYDKYRDKKAEERQQGSKLVLKSKKQYNF